MDNRLQTLFTGRYISFLKTVDSTNSYVGDLLAKEHLLEGAVIVTQEQTAGRGQAGKRWEAEFGKNILMSILFFPVFLKAQNLFMLSKAFSLGIYDTLKPTLGSSVKIKWPNDIYVGDKKICGMLIENSIRNPNINHTILGIGLNVNQENFSAEVPNPVSLKMILKKEQDVDDYLFALCNSLEKRYLQLKSGHDDQINEDYMDALYRFGESHNFENDNEKFKAKITGVAEDGKLFLRRENGLIEKYDFKEVRYII